MSLPPVFADVCKRNGWQVDGDQFQLKLENGRKQDVFVDAFEYGTEPMVRITSVVGSVEHMVGEKLASALRINYGLPHGALSIKGDDLVLTDTFVLKDADADEIESSVVFIAETADMYESSIYGTDEH